jgi:site-specific DNA recombinase
MTTVRAAAIYARISSDRDGQGLEVKRQIADCRKLAKDRGWTVAEVYEDNDQSASSGKRRPAYKREHK